MPVFSNQFDFRRPQFYAAALLLALLVQALIAVERVPFRPAELMLLKNAESKLQKSEGFTSDSQAKNLLRAENAPNSILLYRVVGLVDFYCTSFLKPALESGARARQEDRSYHLLMRAPFVVFGLWLGAALWWVSRRLFNNPGGYVALALYCFSPGMIAMSSAVNAEIIAAWGLFGIVYTAIGVAHTLYAPARKWWPRILLLGIAFGATAAAHVIAAIIGMAMALALMLYLAPGRRLASAGILAVAAAIAAFILWAFYGFGDGIVSLNFADSAQLRLYPHMLFNEFSLPQFALLLIALTIFAAWKRTRYFANWSSLLVFILLLAFSYAPGVSWLWALPFIFAFIGGIFADLLESQWRRAAFAIVFALIAAQAALSLWMDWTWLA